MTSSNRMLSSVRDVKCVKGLSTPPPASSDSDSLTSQTTESRLICPRKDGTAESLTLTAPPTKGIFLTSRKHCFFILDTRPVEAGRGGGSCGETTRTETADSHTHTRSHDHMTVRKH